MAERKLRPLAAALGALALAGCSATHVGEDWQCPLAQGKVCASVAAADPAAPETGGAEKPAGEAPFHRRSGARAAAGTLAPETREAAAGTECGSGCNPLVWLARLFAGPGDAGPGESERADGGRVGDFEVAESDDTTKISAASEPDDGQSPAVGETGRDPAPAGAFRTGEVVARIWIAPFVDADGVYREGSWVRVVIAPAGWRMP